MQIRHLSPRSFRLILPVANQLFVFRTRPSSFSVGRTVTAALAFTSAHQEVVGNGLR